LSEQAQWLDSQNIHDHICESKHLRQEREAER
jgi:hypothetical protein